MSQLILGAVIGIKIQQVLNINWNTRYEPPRPCHWVNSSKGLSTWFTSCPVPFERSEALTSMTGTNYRNCAKTGIAWVIEVVEDARCTGTVRYLEVCFWQERLPFIWTKSTFLGKHSSHRSPIIHFHSTYHNPIKFYDRLAQPFDMRLFRSSDLEARVTGIINTAQEKATKSNKQAAGPAEPLLPPTKSSPVEEEKGPQNTSIGSQRLAEFLDKYDPRPHNDLPSTIPMSEHRAMIRTMYLDNILYNTARLHKHNWILLSQNEKYKECSYSPTSRSCSLD